MAQQFQHSIVHEGYGPVKINVALLSLVTMSDTDC